MRKKVLRLVAMILCLALIFENGNIVRATEVLSEASENTKEDSKEENSEHSEEEGAEETKEDFGEEVSEEVSEQNGEETSEEPSVPPSQESTQEVSEESSEEITEEESEPGEAVEISKRYVYTNYEIDFVIVGQWENGYTANMIIRNVGTEIIHDWTMVMEGDFEIANLWNGEIISSKDNKTFVNNLGWNQDIYPDQEITLGFTTNAVYKGIPKTCSLLDKTEKVISDGYEVLFEKTDIWNGGYIGKITITNISDSIIKDWKLSFKLEGEIISVWDAELLQNNSPSYLVGCPSYNQNIAPGQSVCLGLMVSGMNPDSLIENVTLSQLQEMETEEEYNPGRELEPLKSIGEAYYKDATEADVIINEDTGILYVKNQVLISGVPDEPKKLFEDLAVELGAEIVGYLEITNDYQFEFNKDMSAEELDAIIEEIKGYSYVSFASLNIASYIETDAVSDDAMYCDNKTLVTETNWTNNNENENVIEYINTYDETKKDKWDEDAPDGDNWGLEALRVSSAWEYKEYFEPVKVGMIDSCLNNRHRDVIFDDIINPATSITSPHGTGVAGIIAAQHNNGIGISGVATDVKLYGFDYRGNKVATSMKYKYGVSYLVLNDVKVINVSMGYGNSSLVYGASRGNERAVNYIREEANIMGEFLNKLLILGYDYVIVAAANNNNNDKVVKDDTAVYGYRDFIDDEDDSSQILVGDTWAEFGSSFAAIKKGKYVNVYNRIVVVAACYKMYNETANLTGYSVSNYSNRGERIDVIAPADNIIWTVPSKYEESGYIVIENGGTSTAAPHITGMIALMYQANPALSGAEAKRILCENYSELIADKTYQTIDESYYYKLPDAERCVWNALYGESEPYVVSGTLLGSVVGEDGNPISGAKVCAVPGQWGNYTMHNEEVIVKTDVNGEFQMKLEEQYYHLIISTPGYVPYVHSALYFVGSEKITDAGKIKLEDSSKNVKPEDCNIYGHFGSSFDSWTDIEATIRLRAGWNNQNGPYLTDDMGKEYCSKAEGLIYFTDIPLGEYTAEIKADGYVTSYVNVVSTLRRMRCVDYNVTPILSEDTYVLEVCYTSDTEIDSVAMYYENGIIKKRRPFSIDDEELGIMDRYVEYDNQFYQREVVCLYDTEQYLKNGGSYKYCLYAYDDEKSNALSMSKATVRLYKGNELYETYTIPVNKKGNVCRMLTLDEDGWHFHGNFYDAEEILDVN